MTEKIKIEGARACPSSSGTIHGYSVQLRTSYRPFLFGGKIISTEWQTMYWLENNIGQGVPLEKHWREIRLAGLLTETEAEAFRWHLIATIAANDFKNTLCLETRIVEHAVKYSWSATPMAYIGARDSRGNMPKDMSHERGTIEKKED